MTLHLHCGRWWPMLCPLYGSFVTTRKYVFTEQCVMCFRINHSSVVHKVYQWYNKLWSGSTLSTLVLSLHQGINLIALYFSECSIVRRWEDTFIVYIIHFCSHKVISVDSFPNTLSIMILNINKLFLVSLLNIKVMPELYLDKNNTRKLLDWKEIIFSIVMTFYRDR